MTTNAILNAPTSLLPTNRPRQQQDVNLPQEWTKSYVDEKWMAKRDMVVQRPITHVPNVNFKSQAAFLSNTLPLNAQRTVNLRIDLLKEIRFNEDLG